MKSTDKKHFERIIWLGQAPANKAREQLLAQLLVFLGYEGELAKEYMPGAARQLVLGNAEDFAADWPKPDGHQLFLGLFSSQYPNSESLLSNFNGSKVSFYINETVRLAEIEEYLEDLLVS